jgi:hypothetical protein
MSSVLSVGGSVLSPILRIYLTLLAVISFYSASGCDIWVWDIMVIPVAKIISFMLDNSGFNQYYALN